MQIDNFSSFIKNLKIIDFEDIDCDDREKIKEKLQRINQRISWIGWKAFLGKFDNLEYTSGFINFICCQCENCKAKKCFKCSRNILKSEASKIFGEFSDTAASYEFFCDDCKYWAVNLSHIRDNVPF